MSEEPVVPQETMWALERIAHGYHLWTLTQQDAEGKGLKLFQEIKEATGWSQSHMARRVGCTKHHMSRVFRGKEKVSASLITRMHDVIKTEQGTRDRESPPEPGPATGLPGDGDRLEGVASLGGATRLD